MQTKPIHLWDCLEDRIIIKPDEAPKMTESGLHIPETIQERERPARGTVIVAGPGLIGKTHYGLVGYQIGNQIVDAPIEDMDAQPVYRITEKPVKKGDRVMYSKQAGLRVEDPETKEICLIMRMTDVWIRL